MHLITWRGYGFLLGGGLFATYGYLRGERDLIVPGLVLALLPLISLSWLLLRRNRIDFTRTIDQPDLRAGERTLVRLKATNHGRTSAPLTLHEQLPVGLSRPPALKLDQLTRGEQQRMSYPLRAERRGLMRVGPLHVERQDGLGLVRSLSEEPLWDTITVLPQIETLGEVGIAEAHSQISGRRPWDFSAGGNPDVLVREYRRGDDYRRVHWPSTARHGEVMVRQNEDPALPSATVFLDNRGSAHTRRSGFEKAVTVTSSAVHAFTSDGYRLQLAVASQQASQGSHHWTDPGAADASQRNARTMYQNLALIDPEPVRDLPWWWTEAEGSGGTAIGVFGDVGPSDADLLQTLARVHTDAAAIIVLHDGAKAEAVAGWLRELGWRTSACHPAQPLATAWKALR